MVELRKIIDAQKKVLAKLTELYVQDINKKEMILAQMAKLQEEVGELSEQILKLFKLQKVEKGEFKMSDLEGEIADVLNVVVLISQHLEIDLEKVWTEKIKT